MHIEKQFTCDKGKSHLSIGGVIVHPILFRQLLSLDLSYHIHKKSRFWLIYQCQWHMGESSPNSACQVWLAWPTNTNLDQCIVNSSGQ